MVALNKAEWNDPAELWTGATLLVDKPLEWTSFDVVNKIRIALKAGDRRRKTKVGHTGTLDPLATGLLILCTGKHTKQISEYQGMDKAYTGTIRLGAVTPSYDAETEVTETFDTSAITDEALKACTDSFRGEIDQFPPVFSAVKVDGKRAYKLARKGREVKVRPRRVHIRKFDVVDREGDDLHFEVRCSKGTYIRSLAHDLGKCLDNGAYLTALRRTAIGRYPVENAWELDDLVRYIREHQDAAPPVGLPNPRKGSGL